MAKNVSEENNLKRKNSLQNSESSSNSKKLKGPVECPLCYRVLPSPSHYHAHKTVHKEDLGAAERDIPAAELQHPCHGCHLRFLSPHLLTYHCLREHSARPVRYPGSSQTRFQCILCYQNYSRLSHVERHCRNVHENDLDLLTRNIERKDLVWQCRSCGAAFLNQNILRQHMVNKHSEAKSERRRRRNVPRNQGLSFK